MVAGSKFDTKIGPLSALIEIADHLVLGCALQRLSYAKYGFKISGLTEDDVAMAAKFIADSKDNINKIVGFLTSCNVTASKLKEDNWDIHKIEDMGDWATQSEIGYILDMEESFRLQQVKDVFKQAGTIFVNAVMGYSPLPGRI